MHLDLPEAARQAHDAAVERGAESYPDPTTGYTVLTALTLAARGACCGSSCRHCPYPADEQRRAGRPAAASATDLSPPRPPDRSIG